MNGEVVLAQAAAAAVGARPLPREHEEVEAARIALAAVIVIPMVTSIDSDTHAYQRQGANDESGLHSAKKARGTQGREGDNKTASQESECTENYLTQPGPACTACTAATRNTTYMIYLKQCSAFRLLICRKGAGRRRGVGWVLRLCAARHAGGTLVHRFEKEKCHAKHIRSSHCTPFGLFHGAHRRSSSLFSGTSMRGGTGSREVGVGVRGGALVG